MAAYTEALARSKTVQQAALLTQAVACHIDRALYDTANKVSEKLCPGVNGQPQLLFCNNNAKK